MDDTELLARFEAGTLPSFPHEDHVRTVYLLVVRDGAADALLQVSAGIRAMAQANGRPGAFHVTRTEAWTRIVAAAAAEPQDSREFLAEHPELLRRDLLDDYYAPGRLTTDEARERFMEPDVPLP